MNDEAAGSRQQAAADQRARITFAPARMLRRPRDHRGFPVPWFVAWFDGQPDFRVVDSPKISTAHKQHLCWLCGEKLGVYMTFTIGPMCAVNRVSSELPAHRECAEYAVTVCPFLIEPRMKRNPRGVAEGKAAGIFQDPAGEHLERNPGVILTWTTKSYQVIRDGAGGVLFTVGAPRNLDWWAEGRRATRAEIELSIAGGMIELRKIARMEGGRAEALLETQYRKALTLLPPV